MGVGGICRYVMPRKALRALVANLLTVWIPKFKASGQVFKVGGPGLSSHARSISITSGLSRSVDCTSRHRTASSSTGASRFSRSR